MGIEKLSENVSSVMATKQLFPSEIRFSSDSIPSKFDDGRDVNEVAENVCNGQVSIGDIPIIQLVRRDQKYYSLDNRRLYVFRVGQIRKRVGKIPVLIFEEDRLHPDKHTTKNDGRHVMVENEEALSHYRESWLNEKADATAQNGNTKKIVPIATKVNGVHHNEAHAGTKITSNGNHVSVTIPETNIDDQPSKGSWWACSIL